MANDALAQSGIDIGLSGEVDYDSAYAAVTATERGRWFLTELANRNRRADTDALMAAIARVEAAVRSDASAKQSARLPDVGAAAERLADVAFELRERGADAALCDALDAAVREICKACGSGAKTQETENGAAPDRAIPVPARQAACGAIDADSPSSNEAFDMPLQELLRAHICARRPRPRQRRNTDRAGTSKRQTSFFSVRNAKQATVRSIPPANLAGRGRCFPVCSFCQVRMKIRRNYSNRRRSALR